MLILTAKLPRKKLALGVALGTMLCCCALALYLGRSPAQEAAASAQPSPKGVSSAQKRLDYLRAWGWQVREEPLATEELQIPAQLDESYGDYLALQQGQGFDLAQYAGKRVKRYTYEVTNYPTGEAGVQVNLLIYKGNVIGGEVLSPQLDGFLHGLSMP